MHLPHLVLVAGKAARSYSTVNCDRWLWLDSLRLPWSSYLSRLNIPDLCAEVVHRRGTHAHPHTHTSVSEDRTKRTSTLRRLAYSCRIFLTFWRDWVANAEKHKAYLLTVDIFLNGCAVFTYQSDLEEHQHIERKSQGQWENKGQQDINRIHGVNFEQISISHKW